MIARHGALTVLSALLISAALASPAMGADWMTSYPRALTAAKDSGKPVLVDFTGSDWCVWCQRLDKEVFSTPAFAKWAEKNVVLLKLDFPRAKGAISAAQRKQNEKLAKRYGIRGFPTILVLNAEGETLGRLGYMKGGPQPWTAAADEILARHRRKTQLVPIGSLDEALRQAATRELPVLAVVTETAEQSKAAAEGLFFKPDFFEPANMLTAATHVDLNGADVEAWKKLAAKLDIEPAAGVFLLDARAEKVLASGSLDDSPRALGKMIRSALPEPDYEGAWLTDVEEARRIAYLTDRPMLLDFTGSDWCVWCQRLDEEVFSTETFRKYAAKNLVLVKLDFPKTKPQPQAIRKRNETLARQFGVRGFPTIIVLRPDGRKMGQLGYVKGGPGPWLRELKKAVR